MDDQTTSEQRIEVENINWPAIKTMERIRIVIQIIALLTLMAFSFVTFLNYQANLQAFVVSQKMLKSIENIEAFLKDNISTEPDVNLNLDLNAVQTPDDER